MLSGMGKPPGEPTDADDATAEVATALDAVRRAIAAIDRVRDPQRAFQAATMLVDGLTGLYERAGRQRARIVERVKRDRALALQALGDFFGVSKARADQLLKRAARPTSKKG